MLYCVPVQVNPLEYDLMVIADETTIERMRRHDPAIFQMAKMPEPWPHMRLRAAYFCLEDAEGVETFKKLLTNGLMEEARNFILRGFEDRPDLGDNDRDYRSEEENKRLN